MSKKKLFNSLLALSSLDLATLKNKNRLIYLPVLVFTFLILSPNIYAQCPLSSFLGATQSAPPCGTFSQSLLGSGTYATVNVLSGGSYTFSTCGSSFDTQITGYTAGGSFLFYNDNNGPDCSNFNASVNWISTYTGSLSIMVNRANCQGHDFTGVSAVLKYRQNDNIVFTLPTSICADGSAITLNATPSGGVFSGPGVSGNTFNPSASGSGTHVLTYTFGNCSKSSSITVAGAIINVASFGNPICNGLSNGYVDITANGGIPPYSFVWSNGATTEDIVNVPAGNYQLTVSDNYNCSTVISTTLVDPPVLTSTASATDATCNGTNDGTAAVTVSGGVAPYKYFWSDFSFSQTISQASAGIYTVLVTDSFGCSVTNTVTVGEPAEIELAATVSSPSCGGNDGSVDVTVSGGNSPYEYLWSSGDTTQDLINVPAGTYTLTVTDASLCTNTITATVALIQDSLVASFTINNNVCLGEPMNIVNTSSNVSGQLFYFWDFGNGTSSTNLTPVYTYPSAGTYVLSLRVLSNLGCADSFAQVITVFDTPDATITASPDNSICAGDTATLSALSGYISYSWSDGSTTEEIEVSAANIYTITVTDANGCSATGSITLTVNPLPNATIAAYPDDRICERDTATLSAPSGMTSYVWSQGSITNSIQVTDQGTYNVTVTDANGCSATDDIDITLLPLPDAAITATPGNSICEGEIAVLIAPSGNNTTYAWSTGATGNAIDVLVEGIYRVTVTDETGCSASGSIFISVLPLPDPNIIAQPGDRICLGDNTTLTANAGFVSYVWSNGLVTDNIQVDEEGIYSVTVTDNEGCSASEDIFITVLPLPTVSITPDTSVILGFSIDLEATGGVEYVWSPEDGLSDPNLSITTATPLETTTYTVVVTDMNGCVNTASVIVEVDENAYLLTIPNIITPDGNGQNDRWIVQNITLYPNEVQIFNRWGTLVYSARDYQNEWDGRHNGNEVANGTYYYVINVANGAKIYKGAVTVLR